MNKENSSSKQQNRRANGQGTIYYDWKRARWIGRASVPGTSGAKRREISGVNKEDVEARLKTLLGSHGLTITDKVNLIPTPPPDPDMHRIGKAYFVQGIEGGPIKIGWTTNINSRLQSMQTGSPVPLCVLGVIEQVPLAIEGELHDIFDKYWLRGEWFKDSPELATFIQRLKTAEKWWEALAD